MKKEMSKIIDADLYPLVPLNGKKSARIVSVLQQDKIYDCDSIQMQSEIKLGRILA